MPNLNLFQFKISHFDSKTEHVPITGDGQQKGPREQQQQLREPG